MKAALIGAMTFLFCAQYSSSDASEVKIISVLAMKQVLIELTSQFENSTGSKLVLDFGTVAQVQARVQSGEQIDLVINNAPVIDELIATGKIEVGSRADIARVGIGVAIRSGGEKPDISAVDAFKRALLAAKSISRGDPRNRGAAGLHIESVIERLGIAPEVTKKSRLAAGQAIAELVARGEAELGLALTSEIVTVPGVDLVGTLPRELEYTNVLSAGVPISSTQPKAAATMIDLLRSEVGRVRLIRLGLDPH